MTFRTLFYGATIASTLLPPIAAAANSGELDQIVVTATRTPLSIDRIGSAVSVITRDDIERREARNVSEILRSVPGFAISRTGVAGSQTQIRVRGAEANHVLVLIDGVRANDPATGDEFRWEFLSTGDIERIEIVRGPQSALWGSDAIAAVVHIITQNDDAAPGLAGYAEGGSFGTGNASLGGAYRSAGMILNGRIESLTTNGDNISRSGSEKDDSDLTSLNLSARFNPSDTMRFRAGVRAVDAYSQFDPVDFFVTGLPTDGDRASDTRNLSAHAGASYDNSRGIAHSFDLRWFDSENLNFADGLQTDSTASDRLTAAYQADLAFDDDRLSLALEHERTRFRQRGEASFFGDPNQNQSMDTTGIVAEYQNLSGDRLSWVVSARFDDNSDFDDALAGKFSAAYRADDATTLRASVGTGRKNPTFIERFGFFPGQFVGNPELKPERSTSFDLGIDRRFIDDTLEVQVSLFHQNLEDEIAGFVVDPVTFLATAENRDSESERSGAEIGLRWRLRERLNLSGHYTYTDATEPTADGVMLRELRRPRHAGGLAIDYSTPSERVGVSMTADYGGERTDLFFPPWPQPSKIVTLNDYWLVDAVLRYRATDAVSVFLKGSNLLDESYEQVYGFRTLGRAAYLGVRVDFGRR